MIIIALAGRTCMRMPRAVPQTCQIWTFLGPLRDLLVLHIQVEALRICQVLTQVLLDKLWQGWIMLEYMANNTKLFPTLSHLLYSSTILHRRTWEQGKSSHSDSKFKKRNVTSSKCKETLQEGRAAKVVSGRVLSAIAFLKQPNKLTTGLKVGI